MMREGYLLLQLLYHLYFVPKFGLFFVEMSPKVEVKPDSKPLPMLLLFGSKA
jgi:hypothetical protein